MATDYNLNGENSYPDHKVINDAVHGHVKLDLYTFDMIDTEQFQRLRDLKQLGAAYYVFPGGSHNRFEHSIGVSHLAGVLIERFQRDQPELNITDNEVKCVKLAGLCHDLGHGPYSHVFDHQVMPRARPGLDWSHEQASEMMLEYLIDDNNIDIERDEVNLIKDLIAGTPRFKSQYDDRCFLFDIVANKRNSVDVDKFDYIERDAHNLGLRSSYDATRLLMYSRIVNNEICYHHKEVYNLYEMFHTRYSLFKRIYSHRVAEAIELMITDVMVHADSYLGITSAVNKPEEYLNLTDDILRVVERSKAPELATARDIMKRVRKRDLYKFVDEFLLPTDLAQHINKETITEAEIVAHQSDNDKLRKEDVIVMWVKINYAMKDRNPVDSIQFYSNFNKQESFTIPKQQVSYLIPQQFEEVMVRVFTRDAKKITAIQKAFRRLLKRIVPKNSDTEPHAGLMLPSDYNEKLLAKRRRSLNSNNSIESNDIVKNWQS